MMQHLNSNKGVGSSKDTPTIIKLIDTLKKCIKSTVDKTRYNFIYTEYTKKIQSGSYVLNLRINLNDDNEKNKYLLFVFNQDAKTGMIHVFILDGDHYSPSVLFSTTDRYPVNKLERYVPSIIESTQNMIK